MMRLAGFIAGFIAWLARYPTLSVFLGGGLAMLAMPPVNALPLYYLGFFILYWALHKRAKEGDAAAPSIKRSFLFGWVFGFGQFLLGFYWIGNALLIDAEAFLWVLPFAVIGLPAAFALYIGVACGLWALCLRYAPLRVRGVRASLLLVVLLSLADFARGTLFTGFPWNIAGMAWGGILPLAQSAWIFGVYGMGFLVLLSVIALAAGLHDPRFRRLHFALAFIPLLCALGFGMMRLYGLPAPPPLQNEIKLAIIQPNIEQKNKWSSDERATNYAHIIELTRTALAHAPDTDLIILPETAIPFLIDESPLFGEHLRAFLSPEMILITGALRRENGAWYNSVMGWAGTGEQLIHSDKYHLVPFGEYLPFRAILQKLGLRQLVAQRGEFAEGAPSPLLKFANIPPLAPYICYEAIFPAQLNPQARPEWLVNLTNDGWFGNTIGPYQHLAHARLRAIEEGLPMIRAANTGISAVFDSYGQQLESRPLGATAIILTALPPPAHAGLQAVHGNLTFFMLVSILIIAILGLTFIR